MKLAGIAVYIAIGIIGRKVFGYEGLVETILWPIGIPCTLVSKFIHERINIDQQEEEDGRR